MSNGYVYLLINQSMDGIVKIGKTTRDPENRVNELSNATGVPTPFTLVYKQYFQNCSDAETAIHTALETYRVANNREFFKIPIYEAIEVIKNTTDNTDIALEKETNNISILAYELLEQGLNFYYGNNDELQDYEEAMDYFKRASKLGAVQPYKFLGMMYHFGESCKENIQKAIEYYKEGARKGNNHCYAKLGSIYLSDEDHKHIENGIKCYGSYFYNINPDFVFEEDIYNFMYYLINIRRNNETIEHQNILGLYKDRILTKIDRQIENYYDWYSDKESLRDFLIDELNDIKRDLEMNVTEETLPGTFYGEIQDFLILDSTNDIFLIVDVKHGSITNTDAIEIIGRNFKITKPIKAIKKDRTFTTHITVGDYVGILVEGEREDFLFIHDLAICKNS